MLRPSKLLAQGYRKMDTTSIYDPGLGATVSVNSRAFNSRCIAKLLLFWLLTPVALTACGGGGGDNASPATPTTYSVIANVSGLSGSGLVLNLGNGATINVGSNGQMTLASGLANGAAYSVSVASAPTNPSETCTVSNDTGTVKGSDVSVGVTCTTLGTLPASTMTTIDPLLPASVATSVQQALSPSGGGTVGSWLPISTASSSGQSLVLALDSSGNILLASIVTTDQTTLSADSTALALVRIAIGDIPTAQTGAALDAAIRANTSYPSLVTAVQNALVAGGSPATNLAVLQAVSSVMVPMATLVTAVTTRHSSVKSVATPVATAPLPSTLVTDSLLGLLPVQITQDGANFPFNHITLSDSMPIPWYVTSTSVTGVSLGGGELLSGRSGLLTPGTVQVAASSAGFNLTVAQNLNTEISIGADLITGTIQAVWGFVSAPSCNWQLVKSAVGGALTGILSADDGWVAFLDGLATFDNSPNLSKVLAKCVTSSAAIAALAAPVDNYFGALSKIKTAVNALSVVVEYQYASQYWGTSQTFGVCEQANGAVVNCAARYGFAPASIVMAPGATYTPNITAYDGNGSLTGIPSGLIWTSSNPLAVATDQSTGTLIANASNATSVGGPYTITVSDQELAASGTYSVTVVVPTISPSNATVYIGGGPSGGGVLTLNLTGPSSIILPNGISWTSDDPSDLYLTPVTALTNTARATWQAISSNVPGTVHISATDSSGNTYGPVTVTVAAAPDAILTASFVYQPTAGGGDSAGGEGHFTLDLTTNTVTEFDFVNASNNPLHPGTFTYGRSDLGYLTYNQQTKLLNLSTYAVSATDPIYFPQIFSVSGSSGSNQGMTATQDFPTVPQSSGPVTVTVSGALQLRIAPNALTVNTGSMTSVGVSATLSGQSVTPPANLQWNSLNNAIATVNAGVVSGISVGGATITVTDPNSGATDSAEVTVVSPWAGMWTGSLASTCTEYEYVGAWGETITAGGGNTIILTATMPISAAQTFTVSGNTATPIVAGTYPVVYTLSGNTISAVGGLNGCYTGTLTRQ